MLADRDVLQGDQAEPDRQVLLGALGKRRKDTPLDCHLHFSDSGED